jgi:cyanate permease
MTTAIRTSGKHGALLIAGILMIATTLRVTFTGAAPLLDTLRLDYGLSTAQTGLLTTLPLLAFALISPLAAGLARRIGMERSLFIALLLICAGIAVRSLPSAALLFIGTAVIGCGIALGNVLLPGLIKRDFPGQVAKLTGAYSLTMGAAAALGSALIVPLAQGHAGWQGALLMLMVFPLLALLLWLPQWRQKHVATVTGAGALHNRAIWRSALAWQVTLFLGINSLIYYVIIGWLPAILLSHGYSEAGRFGAWSFTAGDSRAGTCRSADPPSAERSADDRRCSGADVRGKRSGIVVYAGYGGDVDAGVWLWLRGNDDPRPDVHRSARELCASGGGIVRYGTVYRLPARCLRTAADG